jgi:Fe-S-cluster containining protein
MLRKFSCIDECSDCCIYREYYPSIEYGKIGVLLLPNEKQRIETYAKELGMEITILPRVGIGKKKSKNEPETIIAYQLMGKNSNGEVCPFLKMEGLERSPHGGYKCAIYNKRPLACSAYPVNIENKESVILDRKCKFCRVNNKDGEQADGMEIPKFSVRMEIIALRKIQNSTLADTSVEIWRYATGIGEKEKKEHFYPRGWVLQTTYDKS